MPQKPLNSADLGEFRRILEFRARFLGLIRQFFGDRGFLEVDTPVLLPANAPEEHIDAIAAGRGWLRTSPEMAMKRLLAAGFEAIFQLGPCFRAEERGRWHHPEFLMLEWYRRGADYLDILADMKALLAFLALELHGGTDIVWQGQNISLEQEAWEKVTVSQAFIEHAGWDPAVEFDADRFDLDLVEKVEPSLPRDRPVVLMDYPAECASLARKKRGDGARAERWELYLGGVEIANAYTELTDPVEQRARFVEANERRRGRGGEGYPVDEAFLAALGEVGGAGGVAVGVDRLVMVLGGVGGLDGVLPFRWG